MPRLRSSAAPAVVRGAVVFCLGAFARVSALPSAGGVHRAFRVCAGREVAK
jgi:hypothetical protein